MNKNQKLTIMLSMTMALGSVSNTFAAGIKDVDVERVFGKDNKINVLKNKNFVQGFENGDLKLDQGIKRSEITKLLAYANGQEELAKKLEKIQGSYNDVNISYWANGLINAATQTPVKSNGLFMIKGYPDGSFKPENNITYAELAKMLVVLSDSTLTAEDVANFDKNWPANWVDSAQKAGLLEDIDLKNVNKEVNREEAFTMFYNGLYKINGKEIKKLDSEDKDEKKETIEIKEKSTKKKKKSSSSSSNNSSKYEDITEAKEELKRNFIEAAKNQKSETPKLYSLDFDGKNANITFKESGLGENPAEAVKTAANAMLDRVLEVVDEATITVNGEEVKVSKENKNIEALAEAFLGETGVEDFINNGKVEVSFTTKISKKDVKDVEVGEVSATFEMDMDSTREANQNKLIEVAKTGVEKVIGEGSLKDYFKKVTYSEDSKTATATVTIAKDSKISELPQDGTKLMEALEAGLDLGTIEKLELKLDDENSIEIHIKDKEIADIKSNILKEEKIKDLLEKNLIDLKNEKFVLKASGEKLGEVEYTIKFEEAISGEKDSFHKAAKEAGNKLAEEEELIYSIDYNNGIAKVRVNLDKLEDVKNLENLNTGLFSEVLLNLGVKSVKIGDKDYSVDPSAENFEINKMIEAVLGQLSNNNIKYSAKIEKGGVEFEENFDVTFEFLGNEESKAAKLEELYSVIEEARQVSIKLLNKQKRFYLTDYKTNLLPEEYKNQTTFDFLTDGKGGEPTKETLMSNYVSGSGLATVLGFKNKSETDKAQKARIEFIKSCLDMNTLTVNNENITLPNNILGLMGVKVGDLLGEKKISVKVKDEIAKDTFIEHIIHFDIHVDATEEPKEGEKEQ